MPAQTKSDTEPRVLTVRELLREHKLPAFRVGADWRFNREAIERWMTHEQKRS